MTDVSKIAAHAYVEKNNLTELVTIGDNGIYSIPADLHELLALVPAGITPKQFETLKIKQKELAGGMLYHTGNLAVDHFKANPEAVELGFSYGMGSDTTVTGLFNREAKDHTVLAIDTKYKNADLKRVLSYLGDQFENINS